MCTYTIKLSASEHGKPEVRAPKMKEIQNLQEYDTFEEVRDEGQEKIGS